MHSARKASEIRTAIHCKIGIVVLYNINLNVFRFDDVVFDSLSEDTSLGTGMRKLITTVDTSDVTVDVDADMIAVAVAVAVAVTTQIVLAAKSLKSLQQHPRSLWHMLSRSQQLLHIASFSVPVSIRSSCCCEGQ